MLLRNIGTIFMVGRYANGAIKLALNLYFQLMQMIVMFLKKKNMAWSSMTLLEIIVRKCFKQEEDHFEDVKECFQNIKFNIIFRKNIAHIPHYFANLF